MLTIKWIWQNLKGNHGKYIVATVMQLIVAGMVVITPSITGKIIDQVVVGIKNASGVYETHPEKLVPLLIGMVGIHVTRMLGYYVLIILFEISAQGMKLSLRTKMYDNLQLLDMSYYSKSNTGDLMTRLTGDLDMMRHGATNVYRQLINSVVIYVAALAYLFTINWLFTLILMITSPMFFFARNRFSKKARPLFQATRERLSELNGYAQENIESNRVVKAFAKEEYECGRFKKYNEAFKQSNLKASFAWLNMHPIVESISQSLSIIIVLVGGLFVINGSLTFGELSVFLSLSWAISSPMSTIGVLLSDFERFITSTNKVMEVFYAKSNIVNPENAYKKEEKVQGKIDFNHVNFSYDGAPILTDIDFHIKPGQTLAVMGCTGSGKTTIASLIGRFYDVKSGEVLVDDINVKKYDIQYLRRNIGMATQDVFLFSETVDSNIAYGNEDLPEEEVIKCAKAADADSFISKMPAGYNTIIGERGVGLSGGQRQRIALARAIAVKPSILILDDTTSAVDVETEQYIWAELEKLNMNCTMVIIANRVSSVYKADCIIVLDNGRIAEMGSHQQLMSKKGYYYETFMLQNEGVIAESETGKAGE